MKLDALAGEHGALVKNTTQTWEEQPPLGPPQLFVLLGQHPVLPGSLGGREGFFCQAGEG